MRLLHLLLALARHSVNFVRRAAAGYEPAVMTSLAAATFVAAAQLGINVGDLPEKVDAVLTWLSVVATLVAGARIRAKVEPAKSAADRRRATEQLAQSDSDDPVDDEGEDADLMPLPGEHRKEG
jgi:hypothetical protein